MQEVAAEATIKKTEKKSLHSAGCSVFLDQKKN